MRRGGFFAFERCNKLGALSFTLGPRRIKVGGEGCCRGLALDDDGAQGLGLLLELSRLLAGARVGLGFGGFFRFKRCSKLGALSFGLGPRRIEVGVERCGLRKARGGGGPRRVEVG